MQRMLSILFATILLLLISINDSSTSAMHLGDIDQIRIPLLRDTDKRNANSPNPNLPNLSIQGKEVEEELARQYHPTNTKAVGTVRALELWHRNSLEENKRNYHHIRINNYTDDIKVYKKYKQSKIGKVQSKIPILRRKQDKKGAKLYENYNNAK